MCACPRDVWLFPKYDPDDAVMLTDVVPTGTAAEMAVFGPATVVVFEPDRRHHGRPDAPGSSGQGVIVIDQGSTVSNS